MFSCVAATAGFLGGWALILSWHMQAGGMPPLPANGMAYAALAIYAGALVGRCAAKWHPALKRVAVLIACAALAGADVGITGLAGEDAQKTFFAALLGIALVVLAARHAPAALRQRWLGKDGA
jgi:peptidoglycan/LPS O-acetylase OafA/YrhL